MGANAHIAYAEEQAHLISTLTVVDHERELAREELAASEEELKQARRFDPDKLPVREMLYATALQSVKNMALARKKPYFTRIDFTETRGSDQTYYIGKYGVMRTDTLESVVVDWRAPLANLYYSGQLGHVEYTAPDGRVEGEITLKRQFDIANGELASIFDTDIVSQDAYLQSALGAMTGDRLKEIVTTIQAEQNFVIRHPLNTSLVVQGVAGSGKTTIALHRIAYLLYAFREQLRPENMVILAPNPLFLNFIAGVLPDLGVERVVQTTFARLIGEWLGASLGKIDFTDRTEKVLNLPETERNACAAVARLKGSLCLMDMLDEFMADFEARFAPEDGIRFGPVTLWTHAELTQFLLVDEKPFPMERRVAEFKKQLQKRVNAAAKRINAWLTAESDRRAAALRKDVSDPAELKARLARLYQSLDERVKQTDAQVKPFVKAALDALPSLTPRALYENFWQKLLDGNPNASVTYAARYTLRRFAEKKPLEPEDIAPIAYIAMRVCELKKFSMRHIVVDEAQDFNPFEIALLSKMMPAATFTIVGDLMQGIHAWRGMLDWRDITEGVFQRKCTMHQLVTSYRNSVEIMETALRVARRHPTPGQAEAKPVIRHGPPPEFCAFSSREAQVEMIAQTLRAWKADGMRAIAVIARKGAEVQTLFKLLPEDLGARVLNVEDAEYDGGVYIAPAFAVKGLEFDGVILADTGEDAYPDADMDARLLYVCLTRPLHRLQVLYSGRLTRLLCAQ